MADSGVPCVGPSIVDVLMGRHQHEPLVKITRDVRLYCNYRLHQPSYEAEVATSGRHRNRPIFDLDPDARPGINLRGGGRP